MLRMTPKTNVTQAQCYMKIRRFDLAIETLSKAILLKPDYAKAYQWRALVHGMKNEPSHAIEDFTAAIQLNPNDARTLLHSRHGVATHGGMERSQIRPDNCQGQRT